MSRSIDYFAGYIDSDAIAARCFGQRLSLFRTRASSVLEVCHCIQIASDVACFGGLTLLRLKSQRSGGRFGDRRNDVRAGQFARRFDLHDLQALGDWCTSLSGSPFIMIVGSLIWQYWGLRRVTDLAAQTSIGCRYAQPARRGGSFLIAVSASRLQMRCISSTDVVDSLSSLS